MDRDFLIDLFSEFGEISLRRMFSGYGISAGGVNFALVLRGALYFRVDEQNVAQFEREGSTPFKYATRAKEVTVGSYWQLPERLFDEPEELAQWAHAALAAAKRAAAGKRTKASKPQVRKAETGKSKTGESKTGESKAGKSEVGSSGSRKPTASTTRKKAATKPPLA